MAHYLKSKVVFTTKSGSQMRSQTEPAIRLQAGQLNNWLRSTQTEGEIIPMQRHLRSSFSGSETWLFATDDEQKAEGYHPYEDSRMLIGINEGKSVRPDIYEALRRCHGYSDWLETSSPGEEQGDFYRSYMSPLTTQRMKVDYTMCPHISETERLRMVQDYGEDHPLYRSSYLAEFVSQEDTVIITDKMVRECIEAQKKLPPKKIRISAGVDFGCVDETVITIYSGNKPLAKFIRSGFPNETAMEDWCAGILKEYSPNIIPCDYTGMSRGAVSNLIHKHGLSQIVPTLFGGSAQRKHLFSDRGAELYGNAKRLIESKLIEIDEKDHKLIKQLTTRRYHTDPATNKIRLEPKQKAKARGVESPDRADSLVLCLSGYTLDELDLISPQHKSIEASDSPRMSEEELLRHFSKRFTFTKPKTHGKAFYYQ